MQGANLEREMNVRVMDRPEVILDIFSTRARSHEAKLQVELAQLEYLLPRLTRMWTHLSRIRGGIGLRGPGETQLETDRRIIRRRIQALKQKLKDVEKHRENIRAGRDPMLSVALVGYTNAGKSSVLRALSGQHEIVVEDRLFATLDTLTREVDLGEGQRARVTDTVGFIRKLPHHLVASFRATLEEARGADMMLHIVDASHPDWEGQMHVVERVLAELDLADRPIIPVFNKMDALTDPGRIRHARAGALPGSADRDDDADQRPRLAQGQAARAGARGQTDGAGAPPNHGRRAAGSALPGRRGVVARGERESVRRGRAARPLAGGAATARRGGGGAGAGGGEAGEGGVRTAPRGYGATALRAAMLRSAVRRRGIFSCGDRPA